MKTKKEQKGVVGCYCLNNNGHLHCPLSTDRFSLERMFNVLVRGESISFVEIDKAFICKEERQNYCKNCPFK